MKVPFRNQSIAEGNGATLLTSATMYPKRPDPWLTIKANSLDWGIFAPNWKDLAESPAEELENLVAQSIGLNPVFSNYSWVLFHAIPALEKMGDVEKCNQLNEFIRRVDVANKNIEPFGKLKPIVDVDTDKPPRFSRLEFMAFSKKISWTSPPEFQPDKEAEDTHLHPKDCFNDTPAYLDQNHPMFSKELSIAIKAWLEVLKSNPAKPKQSSRKKLIETWLESHYPELFKKEKEAKNRIATLLNPDKKSDTDLHAKDCFNEPPAYLDQNHLMFSKELSIAIEAWHVLLECNPAKPKLGSRKKLISDWLISHYSTLSKEAKIRIVTLLNPDKNGGAPSPE